MAGGLAGLPQVAGLAGLRIPGLSKAEGPVYTGQVVDYNEVSEMAAAEKPYKVDTVLERSRQVRIKALFSRCQNVCFFWKAGHSFGFVTFESNRIRQDRGFGFIECKETQDLYGGTRSERFDSKHG